MGVSQNLQPNVLALSFRPIQRGVPKSHIMFTLRFVSGRFNYAHKNEPMPWRLMFTFPVAMFAP